MFPNGPPASERVTLVCMSHFVLVHIICTLTATTAPFRQHRPDGLLLPATLAREEAKPPKSCTCVFLAGTDLDNLG